MIAKSKRDGLHTRFIIKCGVLTQTASVRSSSSYMSVSDRRVYFGLGSNTKIDSVEIRWPSGAVDLLHNISPDISYVVKEGQGIVGKLPAKASYLKN